MTRALARVLATTSSLTLAAAVQALAQTPPREPLPAPPSEVERPRPDAPRPAESTAPPQAAATATDAVFITKAAEAGAREVSIARLGVEKAAGGEVKTFAARVAREHTTINASLDKLAKSKDVDVPSTAQTAPADLASLAGTAFDRAFIALMVKEHETAIALFEGEARDGRDADVKEWAAKQLPTLREHLTRAKALQGKASS